MAEDIITQGRASPPKELTNLDSWVTYRIKPRPDGKLDKIPTDPDTGDNKSKDAFNLSYEQAHALSVNSRWVSGTGFNLRPDLHLTCIDLDGCRDPQTGKIEDWAQQIIDSLGSYTEASVSETGVHIFVWGTVTGANVFYVGGHKAEVYSQGRFIAVTGDHIPGTPTDIRSGVAYLNDLAERYPKAPTTAVGQVAGGGNGLSDDDVLARARNGKNSDKFQMLFDRGDITGYSSDRNRADAALVEMLGFWTNYDGDQTTRLWQQSALSRDKTFRADYIRRTLDFAFSGKGPDDGYQPDGDICLSQYKNPLWDKQIKEAEDVHLSHRPGPNGTNKKLRFLSLAELEEEAGEEPNYIAQPFLARGGLTTLSGPAKYSGKTTWTLRLVAAVLDGRDFLSYPSQKTRVLYLTEQGQNFVKDAKAAGLDPDHPGLKILPWHATRGFSWPEIVEAVREEACEFGAGLVVVDTLNRFAGLKGDEENNAGHVSAIMVPLMEAAQVDNLAILAIRHANKDGDGRGSSQFDHDVDQLLKLRRPQLGGYGDNVRELESVGRYDNSKILMELNHKGYQNLGGNRNAKLRQAQRLIGELVSSAPDKPTPRKTLVLALKEEHSVSEQTTDRALEALCGTGALAEKSMGGRGGAKGYYRPDPNSPNLAGGSAPTDEF
jgi:putative DNA primase/helicase